MQGRVRRIAEPAGAGSIVLALALAAPWVHFSDRMHLGDVRHYHALAEKILDGSVPYDQLFVEYPPGALPIFLLPTTAGQTAGTYGIAFRAGVVAATVLMIVAVVATCNSLGASRRRSYAAAAFVGVSPALLGSTFVNRYDIWPAAVTSLALLALVRRREGTAAGLLGLGAAMKIYPAMLIPLVLIRAGRRRGPRQAGFCAAAAAAVFALLVAPFALLAAGGVGYSFKVQMTRLLEIESVGGAALLCAHRLGLYAPTIHYGFSSELVGRLPDLLGSLQTIILAGGLLLVWWAFLVSSQTDGDLLLAAATTIAIAVAFDRVLSPQYVVWLIPLVALLWNRAGAIAWVLFASATLLTLAYFPRRFHDLRHGGPSAWIVLGRNGLLVALAAFLTHALCRRRRRRRSHSPANA